MQAMFTTMLRRHEARSPQEAFQAKIGLADMVVLQEEMRDHTWRLEHIIEICEAVSKGRYLEDIQRCHWGDRRCEYACTRADEHCDSFDTRAPHQAILETLEDVEPFSAELRQFIEMQAPLQYDLDQALFGPQGFLSELTMYQMGEDEDGQRVMAPMSSEEKDASIVERYAENLSMTAMIDQYEVNIETIRRLAHRQGSLDEIASIIRHGLPSIPRPPSTLS